MNIIERTIAVFAITLVVGTAAGQALLHSQGTGDDFFAIEVDGPAIAVVTHQGSSNFIVQSWDQASEWPNVLVNVIGDFDGTVPVGFDSDPVDIEIQADGSWTLAIMALDDAVELHADPPQSGVGPMVLDLRNLDPRALNLSHEGSSNFQVIGWSTSSVWPDVLVNEIGGYDGRVRLPSEVEFLQIEADGVWEVEAQ